MTSIGVLLQCDLPLSANFYPVLITLVNDDPIFVRVCDRS